MYMAYKQEALSGAVAAIVAHFSNHLPHMQF